MYVLCLQNTVAHYIVTRPILELCLAGERRTGVRANRWWWGKAGITFGMEAGRDAEGMRELEAEGEREDAGYMVARGGGADRGREGHIG